MHTEVIEFAIQCPEHGVASLVVPANYPRPRGCPHCFSPHAERREVRRFTVTGPLPGNISEAWIG